MKLKQTLQRWGSLLLAGTMAAGLLAGPVYATEPQPPETAQTLAEPAGEATPQPTAQIPQPTQTPAPVPVPSPESTPASALVKTEPMEEATVPLYQEGGYPLTEQASQPATLDDTDPGDVAGATAAILDGLQNVAESIDISAYKIPSANMWALYGQIIDANPQLFYCTGGLGWSYDEESELVAEVRPKYNEYATAECRQQYEAAVSAILAEVILPDMTDFQKALALHEYLALHVQYDFSGSKYDAYSALVGGSAVCQGYTLAYHDLLNRVGIPSVYAESREMDHIWNILYIDGAWRHVDVTWDDTIYQGQVDHIYFLKSDAHFNSAGADGTKDTGTHYVWVASQACTDTTYDTGSYWQDLTTAVYECGNTSIYLDSTGSYTDMRIRLMQRDLATGTATELAGVLDYWPATDGDYYVSSYASLTRCGDAYYFNDADRLYRYADGAQTTVYTNTDATVSIFGSLVLDSTKAKVVLTNDPRDPSNVVEVTLTGAAVPTPTPEPTATPTAAPTAAPTATPTAAPTAAPQTSQTQYIVCEACGYHSWTPYMGGYKCTHCGHLRGTTGVATSTEPTKTGSTIPQTGDTLPLVPLSATALLALCGISYVVYKKRKTR